VLISLLAVLIGAKAGDFVNPKVLKITSGLLFIGIGLYTLMK
jgi:putative Mn2+ efflux pump MntP